MQEYPRRQEVASPYKVIVVVDQKFWRAIGDAYARRTGLDCNLSVIRFNSRVEEHYCKFTVPAKILRRALLHPRRAFRSALRV